ncbi:RNA-binding domain-containing protein [uncultured Duncaniella sp.]|jgi:ATP-dependent DNA helicase RecG|uniref:RNA-binding domain-containing protein n=4 Tax=Bacteroidales TaxID=171549 RepID=UPI000F495293|nr:RNA-binding domain-containing protein [uncultured Duncaniella sp.]ROS88680.1 ATP-dependent DNA helicase RecG [Muribaculaceae bacterium Isolate-080 (Janvier)]
MKMKLSLNYIRQLASASEGVDVEFKETTGQLNRGMETLCGMMNGNGGIVVFGVTNKGKIIGQDKGDKTTREIGEALRKFDPAVDIQPDYIEIEDTGKFLIAFQTDGQDPDKPFLWDGKPYMRHDSVTSVMPREKFIRLHELQHGLIYKWENEVNASLKIEDLDERLIMNVVHGAVRRGRLSNDALNDSVSTALTRLNLVKNGSVCNSAAVLFGKDFSDYPQCRLRLARFKGTNKQYFIDNQQHVGNIFQLVDAAMAFFFKHLNLSGTTHHRIVREDELEIPYDALREAVVNAYCHMRWGYEIATVGIAIYDDCIVIENAGRFPVRISPNALMQREEEDRKNTSMPPNPAIANVMYIGGLIEHRGRGLSMMARECERVGLPAPTFNQDCIIVKTTFVRPYDTSKDTAGVSKSKLGVSKQTDDVLPIKASLLKLIKAIGEDWYSSYDLCDILGYKSRNTFVRQHLNPAIDGGIIALEKPDKPNAPNQRYGLTLKGKALYYERHEDKFDVKNDPQKDLQNNFEGQIDPQNTADDPQKAAIFKAIKSNPSISRVELANTIGCSESTIKRRLKEWNIAWLGHPKTGHWVFVAEI